ncbi:TonB system transport protein ExbD [Alsobacter metallidurans]|uniref:Biopolymer transport protein ExbD n=1 Tax=Alsobacter metallidurans TaxID=340221 RepID=A0A917I6V1_9HYPH|nr:TonB system transport protein ExbD [Alsobacter metallidurans]GGH16657.1 TonB system transport protein ExbD [Alsobacter metallidurans]
MGISLNTSSDDDLPETSDINVTPFIDVILVLLIIFMVAAPLSTVDAPVDLPVSTAKPQPRPDKPVYVTLKADLSLLIGDEKVDGAGLAWALDTATRVDREQRIFVRADQAVPYGELTQLMNRLRGAGYLKVALVALEGGPGPATPGPVAPAVASP